MIGSYEAMTVEAMARQKRAEYEAVAANERLIRSPLPRASWVLLSVVATIRRWLGPKHSHVTRQPIRRAFRGDQWLPDSR